LRRCPRVHRLDGGADVVGSENAFFDQELANGGFHRAVVADALIGVGKVIVAVAVVMIVLVVAHRLSSGSSQC
jgi:hypothetical protein